MIEMTCRNCKHSDDYHSVTGCYMCIVQNLADGRWCSTYVPDKLGYLAKIYEQQQS